MTPDSATLLAGLLESRAAKYAECHPYSPAKTRGVKVFVDEKENRIVFTRGPSDAHSLDVSVSTEERVWFHFQGFCGLKGIGLPEVGRRVTFRRGMFGLWDGTVEHVGVRRGQGQEGRSYFTVSFKRRNGSVGKLRVDTHDLAVHDLLRPQEARP